MAIHSEHKVTDTGKTAEPGPLSHRGTRGLLLSELVSATGTAMTALAVPWFVLITTGSVARMGIVYATELAPIALLGVPSGLYVKRLGVRRVMLISDALRAPLIALIPILHIAGVLSFPVLLVIVAFSGVLTSPYMSAQQLALPEIVGEDEQLMTRAGGLLAGANRVAGLIGPVLAGVLISSIGVTSLLWIDAATFVFSFCMLLTLPRPAADLSAGALSQGFWTGARAVLRVRLLFSVTAAALIFGFFFPFVIAALPYMADIRFGHNAHIAGLLLAAWGAGGVAGAVLTGPLAARVTPMRLGAAAALAMAAALWILPWQEPAVLIGLALVLAGIFVPLLNAPLMTLLMTRTSPEDRAQAVTFVVTANLIAGPLAYAASGFCFQAWGLQNVLLIVATGMLGGALVLVRAAFAAGEPGEAVPNGDVSGTAPADT
jgi:predicted MFS family arabinose efflux permease